MKRTRRQQGPGVFDLIEEATQLLRTAPAATLAVYYLGAIPFVLGLLFFWADMSRDPFAGGRLAGSSLGTALLFLWMKFWQAIFAGRIRAQLAGRPPRTPGARQAVRILLAQVILQPAGLFLIPLSAIPVLPFAWAYAFFQNVTALSGGDDGVLPIFKKSWRQAALWPRQNNLVLAILAAFGFYVFLNWTTVCVSLPALIKMLFGVESSFSRSPMSLFNSTFFAAMFGLTYLCVDPILKSCYALRCFYGESLESGEDLKAEVKQFAVAAGKIAALLAVVCTILMAPPVRASDPGPAPVPRGAVAPISAPALDRAINRTIHERKYTWRMPREKIQDDNAGEGFIGRFFDKIGTMLRQCVRAVAHWLGKIFDAILKWLNWLLGRQRHPAAPAGDWGFDVRLLLWGLITIVACVLAIFLYRFWITRRISQTTVASEPIRPAPDVADENVGADQLPEEGWNRLARELLARGDLRLAMRAFYLASLSHLATRNLISIARFKSNRDYERELRRRGHSYPGLVSIFGENISIFEGIWYGMHDVNADLVNQFAVNVERIKSAG